MTLLTAFIVGNLDSQLLRGRQRVTHGDQHRWENGQKKQRNGLGQIFPQMRQKSGLPPVMIAARLGIEPGLLQVLESGAVLALPDWPETQRIVRAYARLVGVDASVPLNRIRAQRFAGVPALPPGGPETSQTGSLPFAVNPLPAVPLPAAQVNPAPAGPASGPHPHERRGWIMPATGAAGQPVSGSPPHEPMQRAAYAPPAVPQPAPGSPALSPVNPLQPPARPARPETEAAQRRLALQSAPPAADEDARSRARRRHPAKTALRYITVPMIVLAGLWYTVQNPTTVHAALGQLPEPLPSIARAGMELVLISTAPTKDGLRMMPAGDPGSRKTDRLPMRGER